jgi:hypothetical protein
MMVTSTAIEEALFSEASHALQLVQQLSSIAIAVRLNITSCLIARRQLSSAEAARRPTCKMQFNLTSFAAAVESVQRGPQRAAIGCVGGCGPESVDGRSSPPDGGSGVSLPVEVMQKLEDSLIGEFVASACLSTFAFVLAARRGILPLALSRRMPPILRPPRHIFSHGARGLWVLVDSPLYTQLQMYSTDMPFTVATRPTGRTCAGHWLPTREDLARSAPFGKWLRSGSLWGS